MAEFPALPLWTDAYLADTRHLSTLEHGAYLLLLMEAWRRPHCDLPDDDRILARLAGLSGSEWADVKPIVMDLWILDGRSKTWKQKRLTDERAYVKKKSRSQSDKATKRWNKTKTNDAAALPDECPGDAPTPTPTEEEPKGSPSSRAPKQQSSIPADFDPVLTPSAQEDADFLGAERTAQELRKFRDHYTANGKRMKDWQAAFRTWLNNAAQWTRERNGTGTTDRHQSRDQQSGFRRDLYRDLNLNDAG